MGVGADMAAGSHGEKGKSADLVIKPKTKIQRKETGT